MKNFKTADWEANKLGDTASIEFAKVGKQKSRKGGKMNIKKIDTPPQISPRKINPRTSTIKAPKNQSPKKTIASVKPSRISTPAKSLKVKHSIQNPSQDRNTSASPDKSQNKVQYRSPRKRKASPVKSAQSPAKKFKGDQNNKGSPSKLIKNKTNAGEQNGNVDASNTCDTNNKSPSSNKNPQARVSDIVLGSNKILQVKLRRLSLNYIQKMTSKANSPGKTATSVSPTNKLNAGVRSMKTKKSTAKHNGKLKIKIAGLFSNSKKIAGTITLNKPSKFAKKDTKTTENAVKAVPKTKKIKKANGATPKAKTASPKKIPPSESPKQGSGALNGVEKSTTSSSKITPKSNLTPREIQRNRTKLNNKMFLRMPKKTETLHKKMSEKLKAARFRYINEQLYTINSSEAVKMFKEDPDSFHAYHAGYRQQVDKWPMNPLTNIINRLKKMPDNVILNLPNR